jgi:hypothetical protein
MRFGDGYAMMGMGESRYRLDCARRFILETAIEAVPPPAREARLDHLPDGSVGVGSHSRAGVPMNPAVYVSLDMSGVRFQPPLVVQEYQATPRSHRL